VLCSTTWRFFVVCGLRPPPWWAGAVDSPAFGDCRPVMDHLHSFPDPLSAALGAAFALGGLWIADRLLRVQRTRPKRFAFLGYLPRRGSGAGEGPSHGDER
jgi:hypothetical protein